MKKITKKQYVCDDGKIFRRKSDSFIMGNGLDLGDKDSIENYEEIEDTTSSTEKEEPDNNE